MIGGFLQTRFGEDAFLFPAALAALLALIAIALTVLKPGSAYVTGAEEYHPPDARGPVK